MDFRMKQENVHRLEGLMNPKYLQDLVDFGQKNINNDLPYIAKTKFAFHPKKRSVIKLDQS